MVSIFLYATLSARVVLEEQEHDRDVITVQSYQVYQGLPGKAAGQYTSSWVASKLGL